MKQTDRLLVISLTVTHKTARKAGGPRQAPFDPPLAHPKYPVLLIVPVL